MNCKKCNSSNLYLEPRVKGQDVLKADMVALKCADCGAWQRWCSKEDRPFYLTHKINRLTVKTTKGYALAMKDNYIDEAEAKRDLMNKYVVAVNKLAEYENLNLTPQQIKEKILVHNILICRKEGENV